MNRQGVRMSEFRPRPGQKEVLAYTAGKMGISAVPGSGKTRTLAELAARLVAGHIADDQEVLVVTLVNSAVDNFKSRINESVTRRKLLAGFGYRVRTLHGLAHDIVRERPGLVGLSDDFRIIDEREADAVRDEAVEAWLRSHPGAADPYLSLDLEGNRAEWVKRAKWPATVRDVAAAFVKRAKDLQLGPETLLERLAAHEAQTDARTMPLARMGTEIYALYQRSLAYRGAVDFDDLIRLALEALKIAPDYLARLQYRWPYILEDEAQDSSELQENILRLLAGEEGNWVRVGDPNQAIYDTFTNANPRFLRQFLEEPGVTEIRLPKSGRSQPAIIDLANYLVDWTGDRHPAASVRGAFMRQHIEATDPGDPQRNPDGDPTSAKLIDRDYTPAAELAAVADSVGRWLPDHPDQTVAVLVPRNQRGFDLIELLKQRQIPCVELLRSTTTTRQTAGSLGNILRCLADPTSARKLSTAFKVWRRADRDDPDAKTLMEAVARRIRDCPAVESYLWPRADHDWLAALNTEPSPEEDILLTGFRDTACRWHRAAALPIDQLVLTLANDLFQEPAELALAHKLSGLLRDVARAHPSYRLAELVEELAVIARNERRFLGFASTDTGFEPPPGKVTITTMHKAKGLEWDRVYLLSVNNYGFPSGLSHDTYIAERWYLRKGLNLEAETLAQLEVLDQSPIPSDPSSPGPVSPTGADPFTAGEASRQARLSYVSERLRLLYVGITRAKRDLIITWNTGNRPSEKLQPAVPFIALRDYWESKR
jgi:DNA helicase-2/ATP-dependent DNA helicase PcrA